MTRSYDDTSFADLELAVAITAQQDEELRMHFRHPGRQEDLTFALWRPSSGTRRVTAVLHKLLLPADDERILDRNVSFTADYLSRVLAAVPAGSGVALLHSHLGPGWQNMSNDDVIAERDRLASAVAGRTGLPLLGLTWGTDRTWSARFWARTAPFAYARLDAAVVRVVGPDQLALSFHPKLRPAPAPLPSQLATVSVWGEDAQHDVARARVGVIGVGSVGSVVVEALARVGVSDITAIDHDRVEQRNLDRTLHAGRHDAKTGMHKVTVAERGARTSHTAQHFQFMSLPISVLTREGYEALLDCDVIISCVDRPWPRWLLNAVSYAHLIPVIDGGILARITHDGKPLHIDWRIHTVGPGRACLICLGALRRSDVALDREGLLDDPDYLKGLTDQERDRYNRRNVFPFSLSVAAHEVLQFVGLVAGSQRVGGVGPQHYAAYPGEMTVAEISSCAADCETADLLASAADIGHDLPPAGGYKIEPDSSMGPTSGRRSR